MQLSIGYPINWFAGDQTIGAWTKSIKYEFGVKIENHSCRPLFKREKNCMGVLLLCASYTKGLNLMATMDKFYFKLYVCFAVPLLG